MDLAIISIIVTGVTTVLTGVFALLSRIQKCRSLCCSISCIKRQNVVEDVVVEDENNNHIPNQEQLFARVSPNRQRTSPVIRVTSPTLD